MDKVIVTEGKLVLPSYREPEAEKLPMFAETRVHQRSSGNPYPNPVVMEVDREHRENKSYCLVTLENAYLRLEILPELGGRIYSALDKITGYDFFYKQHVMKPALIGMLGSWVSGGVEFNWPCHHRPSTFMPVDYTIQRDADGAAILWMSEHEPLDRMKGMVGIRLAPNEARFETRMRVFNRTPMRRSFLWWENAAVPVNKDYELFFPPDVEYVQFHYRKNVTSFPIAKGVYNGIRMEDGKDIRYHKNTLQPTSYFCAASHYDFFGGYDRGKKAGVVHIGDHAVSVGKKMFTWAYSQLGKSWEKALTDTDGMYAELMASSYSNNQPDFAWLDPYEEKSFSQSWYPIGKLGAPVCANLKAALAWEDGTLKLQATEAFQDACLQADGMAYTLNLTPGEVWQVPFATKPLEVILTTAQGDCILRYCPREDRPDPVPQPIQDNPTLEQLTTAQDCYLAGIHVAQYRDPLLSPAAYFYEALTKEPNHAGAHQELARWLYDRFDYAKAWEHIQAAWQATTIFNYHPTSGDIPYLAGLILEALDRNEEAEDWYQRAAWNQDARSRAMTRLAMLMGRKGNYHKMAVYAQEALEAHPCNGMASAAKADAWMHLQNRHKALETVQERLAHDKLDLLCGYLAKKLGAADEVRHLTDAWQNALDLAENMEELGEANEAQQLLTHTQKPAKTAWPWRHAEYRWLKASGEDSFGLACLLYAKGHWEEAATIWAKRPEDYASLRCLAVAYYSHLNKKEEALPLMEKALSIAPHEKQLVWETALLMRLLDVDPARRVTFFQQHQAENAREDIRIEYIQALNAAGQHQKAIDILLLHPFTPCEGGEHSVAMPYMEAHYALGQKLLEAGKTEEALEEFRAAQVLPDSLGAGLWNECRLVPHRFFEAQCLAKLGDDMGAEAIYRDITALYSDYFSHMHLPELACWQALCWKELGQGGRCEMMLRAHIQEYTQKALCRDAGYFAATPFFISFVDAANTQRQAYCKRQVQIAQWAMRQAEKA